MLSLFVCPFIYLLETLTVVCRSLKINARFRLKLKKVGITTRLFRYDLTQMPYDYTVEVRNRFKGLDLIECLMNYAFIVQETGSKTIPKKKKCETAKWLSEEALQIAVKRREVKSYTHLNAEFQRIARKKKKRIARSNKKAFLSDQCKEIEENNRTRKNRDLQEN